MAGGFAYHSHAGRIMPRQVRRPHRPERDPDDRGIEQARAGLTLDQAADLDAPGSVGGDPLPARRLLELEDARCGAGDVRSLTVTGWCETILRRRP